MESPLDAQDAARRTGMTLMRCYHTRISSGSIPLINRAPINPLDPIAYRAAVARSGGQGRRPVFRIADTSRDDARPENVGRRRSLALGRSEHDGRLIGNRDGGPYAAVPMLMALLIAATMIVMPPCVATADPLADDQPSARSVVAAASSDPWADHITEAAKRFTIPERWIRAVMRAESDHDPHAISPKGAMGLMQIMPATWTELRAKYGLGDDPYNPRDNILAGSAYLAELHDLYGSPGFLAAYNAGPGRYEKHLVTGGPLPTETIAYMTKIVPLIDEHAAVAYRMADRPARTQWSIALLFVARLTVPAGEDRTADDLRSDRSSNGNTITDLSALAPQSDGLFVRRSQGQGKRP
ncbi:lytic transglycosylase domain-containing protein [Agrobacterium vitis]|uniref:lytic transglycosylase domain-containing protein n=1 Tax=Agrobacterium vitis TaxID=373 RepID=UPI001F3DAFA1|nr:lytic transglycosylase domain-containing protein [Agrobacterium vitis]